MRLAVLFESHLFHLARCAGREHEGRAERFKKPMFMEPAFQQVHRTAARGNITMWPMPLTDILEELKRLDEAGVDLPRSGEDLCKVVRILLKSSGPLPASLIAHATVRRAVVVELAAAATTARPAAAGVAAAGVVAAACAGASACWRWKRCRNRHRHRRNGRRGSGRRSGRRRCGRTSGSQ